MTKLAYLEKAAASLKGERVALVGGAGFIGHNIALTLKKAGVEVMIVDNLMQNNIVTNVSVDNIDPLRRELYHGFLQERFELLRAAEIEIRNADARNMASLTLALSAFKPTKIVHLSAISSAVDAKSVPGHCFDLQLITLRNVLEYCRSMNDGQINQLVFFSSSTIYGDFEGDTVDESIRPQPYGIYANAKFMGERLVRTYNELYNLGVTIIRPSALYGERCVSRRVSQLFIENALAGKPLLLEGGGDGKLDFTYIEDVVQGVVRSLAYFKEGSSNTYNITYGNARTIADLSKIVKNIVPEAILEERPRDALKPVRGTLLVERAKAEIGFEPQWALEEGYKQYCEWYVEHWQRAQHRLKAAL